MRSHWTRVLPAVPVAAVVGVAADDLAQKTHALLRNYPVLGHMGDPPESIGQKLRQCITSGNEDRPFSRNQRRRERFGPKDDNARDVSRHRLIIVTEYVGKYAR
jgi:hypothetical protein